MTLFALGFIFKLARALARLWLLRLLLPSMFRRCFVTGGWAGRGRRGLHATDFHRPLLIPRVEFFVFFYSMVKWYFDTFFFAIKWRWQIRFLYLLKFLYLFVELNRKGILKVIFIVIFFKILLFLLNRIMWNRQVSCFLSFKKCEWLEKLLFIVNRNLYWRNWKYLLYRLDNYSV